MITAVDTTVLLDIFGADPTFGPRSRDALHACAGEGALVACVAVWAETTSAFPSADTAREALEQLEVAFSPTSRDVASDAGMIWRQYRRSGGPRTRVAADFLIGAHAIGIADRLLTRDSGFYRKYFKRLAIVNPST